MYSIRIFNSNDIDFYNICFSNKSWFLRYSSSEYNDEYLKNTKISTFGVNRYIVSINEKRIGFINIQEDGNQINRRCYLSGGIHPKYLNIGFGIKLLSIGISIAFDILDYNRIQAKVLDRNFIMNKFLQKFNFKKEALLREYEFCATTKEYIDAHLFSLLKSDYPNKYQIQIQKNIKWEIKH